MPWLGINKMEMLKQDMDLIYGGREECPACAAKRVPVFPIQFPGELLEVP